MIEGLITLVVAHEVATQKIALEKTAEEYKALQTNKEDKKQSTAKYYVNFDVSTRGSIKADPAEFSSIVESTLKDSRGWIRAGVKFNKVASGGRLHIVLASGAEIDKYAGCSAELSCTVYPYVLINDIRWRNATTSYTSAGLSLNSYRQMVINHEVGHFLGHDHTETCGPNGVAPVMLQQSTGLRGCSGNSWPLNSELWVTRW